MAAQFGGFSGQVGVVGVVLIGQLERKVCCALFVFLAATAVRDSLKVAVPKASDLHVDALLQVPLNGLEDAGPPLHDLEEEGVLVEKQGTPFRTASKVWTEGGLASAPQPHSGKRAYGPQG